MRIRDGRYESAQCGEIVDIPADAVPQLVMKAAGGKANVRSIVWQRREIHACAIPSTKESVEKPADAR